LNIYTRDLKEETPQPYIIYLTVIYNYVICILLIYSFISMGLRLLKKGKLGSATIEYPHKWTAV